MKSLVRNMAVYGLGGIATKAVNLFLLPIYTRVLLPSELGTIALLFMFGSIFETFCGLMISSGYVRNYFDDLSPHRRRTLFASAFWFIVVMSTLCLSAFYGFSEYLASQLLKTPGTVTLIRLVALSSALHALSFLFYGHLTVLENSRRYVSINLLALAFTIIATVIFVVKLRWSVLGVVVAQLLGILGELLTLAIPVVRKWIWRLSANLTREMLSFAVPLIPLQIASFVLTLSDRFFLKEFRTLEEVGLYSLAYQVAGALLILAVFPLKALSPYIFSYADRPQECKKRLADFAHYYLAGTTLAALVIAMFSRELIMIMAAPGYFASWQIVYLICLAHLAFGMESVISLGIGIVKKTWITGTIWVLAALMNLFLNFLFIPRYGMFGAGLATAISYCAVVSCDLLLLNRYYRSPFRYVKMASLLCLAAITYIVSTHLQFALLPSLLAKSALLVSFAAVVVWGGYFSSSQLAEIRGFVASQTCRILPRRAAVRKSKDLADTESDRSESAKTIHTR